MKSKLVDLLFQSKKRENILMLLKDGPADIETIKKAFDASPTSMQPQLKKLREKYLVVQENDHYKLSEIGEIIVEKMEPLLNTLNVFEENEEFWVNRNLSGIPPHLLLRVCELGQCKIIEPDVAYMFELIPAFVENVTKANQVKHLLSYFHPKCPAIYLELARKGTEISVIVTDPVFKRQLEDYRPETEEFLKYKNAKLFIYKQEEKMIPAVVVTDSFMGISLFPKKGAYDRRYVASSNSGSLFWAEELFEYYRNMSEEVTGLEF